MSNNGFREWWNACMDARNQLIRPVPPMFASRLYSPEMAGKWRPRIDPEVLHDNYLQWMAANYRGVYRPLTKRQLTARMLLVGCVTTRSRFGTRQPRVVLSFGPYDNFKKFPE